MKNSFLILFTAFVFLSCEKLDIAKGTPRCIKKEIKNLNKTSLCDSASVTEYIFQGKTVYALGGQECMKDGWTDVLDEDCNHLGTLGGFSGNTVINGEEFSNATFVRVIWSK